MPRQMDHHKRLELCTTRPAYRQGRKLTAVKVFTINNESQHLLIFGVPKINLRAELKNLCQQYGEIDVIAVTNNYEVELFTECFHVGYKDIQTARFAKKKLDDSSFYGGILHVCYAPEFETLEETRAKLLKRRKDVFFQIRSNSGEQYEEIVQPSRSECIEVDTTEDGYEETEEEVQYLEQEIDSSMTTTSYNIKVITVQKNPDDPSDEDNITTIEVTSMQPTIKRKLESTNETDDYEDSGTSPEMKIKKRIINLDQSQNVNRIIYRKQ